MVIYYCEKDNLEVNTSVCPHCGQRAYPRKSQLYWCKACRIPLYEETCAICQSRGEHFSTDVRPVFPEEQLLLECILEQQNNKEEVSLEGKSLWNGVGNHYYEDGSIIDVKIAKLKELDIEKIKSRYQDKLEEKLPAYEAFFSERMAVFIKGNAAHYQRIQQEAMDYIRNIASMYAVEDMMISFSGGKDSTVVADLVTRTLEDGNKRILHVFGDTTLEFPSTYEYVERYKKAHPKTPILSSKNRDKDFMELCKEIGPPSRVMRWCCTIFKTGAITRKIEKLFRNKTHIVTFYGIRRSESASRNKYTRESDSPKIAKQTVVSPIIDWYDFDVWLYLMSGKVDFNQAYRLGYARVGCWCCPNNSGWSEFLSRIHMPENYASFRDFLVDFAKKIGKPDAEVYVDSGNWKARQGGNGVEAANRSIVTFTPCAVEENSFNYQLQRPIEEGFYELFKPFGSLNFQMGNKRLGEVFVMNKKGMPILKLQGKIGKNQLKVTILDVHLAGARNLKGAEEKIKCQLTKYQMCIGCLACEGVCRMDAITIRQTEHGISYGIDERKCIKCGHCVGHFNAGCYMRKVLAIKRE